MIAGRGMTKTGAIPIDLIGTGRPRLLCGDDISESGVNAAGYNHSIRDMFSSVVPNSLRLDYRSGLCYIFSRKPDVLQAVYKPAARNDEGGV